MTDTATLSSSPASLPIIFHPHTPVISSSSSPSYPISPSLSTFRAAALQPPSHLSASVHLCHFADSKSITLSNLSNQFATTITSWCRCNFGIRSFGLGKRVVYQFVSLFGSSSLGLGYSLVFSEALLAPAIPSFLARASGIFLPLVKSLCVSCGSNVGYGMENKLGSVVYFGAMFTAFLSVATTMGTPPFFGAMVLSFLSNLMGGRTHYGIGSTPVFFGANYVPLAKWRGYGFVISIINILIWLGLGSIWWKACGVNSMLSMLVDCVYSDSDEVIVLYFWLVLKVPVVRQELVQLRKTAT
ncbi:hypothetical protein KIW84_043202 [Lathyrus oleraceus]|uniref:Uncharacterized protein n=1 Tax=Pisum sativum TaxID=3888 RepID=A0A9D4XGV4_PEA|nr:hypothetical protein KIW84_043202 [Pisum sativum]